MSASAEHESKTGHCPACGPNRWADVVGHHRSFWSHDVETLWLSNDYYILRCRGCHGVYFQHVKMFSEDVDYVTDDVTGMPVPTQLQNIKQWPPPLIRKFPEWFGPPWCSDAVLTRIVSEVYTALNNDLPIMTATGIRTAFDRASELLGVDAGMTFQQKLEALVARDCITRGGKARLEVLVDAGSAAAHRGWCPEPRELAALMALLEAFLHDSFVLDHETGRLRGRVPEKPRSPKLPVPAKPA